METLWPGSAWLWSQAANTLSSEQTLLFPWHSPLRSSIESPVILRLPPYASASAAITCTSEPATRPLPSQLLRHFIQIIARQSRLKPLPSDSSLFSASRSSPCDWPRFVLCPTHPGGGLQDSPAIGRRNAVLEKPCLPQSFAAAPGSRPQALLRCVLGSVVLGRIKLLERSGVTWC